jgi:hypothetical protein
MSETGRTVGGVRTPSWSHRNFAVLHKLRRRALSRGPSTARATRCSRARGDRASEASEGVGWGGVWPSAVRFERSRDRGMLHLAGRQRHANQFPNSTERLAHTSHDKTAPPLHCSHAPPQPIRSLLTGRLRSPFARSEDSLRSSSRRSLIARQEPRVGFLHPPHLMGWESRERSERDAGGASLLRALAHYVRQTVEGRAKRVPRKCKGSARRANPGEAKHRRERSDRGAQRAPGVVRAEGLQPVSNSRKSGQRVSEGRTEDSQTVSITTKIKRTRFER